MYIYRITESLRLEKTSKIKSNYQPITTVPAKPCPKVPYLRVFWTPPGMVTPPLPWAACYIIMYVYIYISLHTYTRIYEWVYDFYHIFVLFYIGVINKALLSLFNKWKTGIMILYSLDQRWCNWDAGGALWVRNCWRSILSSDPCSQEG